MHERVGQKILLTDGRNPSCLAFARQLGRQGMEVHVGESFKHHITGYSKFTAQTHSYPSPDHDGEAFKAAMLELIEQEEFDYVIPNRDAATIALAEMRDELPAATHTLLASPQKIETLNNKASSAKLAEEVGVPIPRTYYPTERPIDEISELATFPVLIKPIDSSGARGIMRVGHRDELQSSYRSVRNTYGAAVIQEFVDHSGGHFSVGTVFDRNSDMRALHVYQELVQYPDSGGPAIRAVSVEPGLWVDDLLQLLREIEWVGPAHMDVLLDPVDETFKLLEVNPRIWMSVHLSIASGVDIPGTITKLAEAREVIANPSYRTDLCYRWMLPNEILWVLSGKSKLSRLNRLRTDGEKPICFSILARDDVFATAGVLAQSLHFLRNGERRKMILDRGWSDD